MVGNSVLIIDGAGIQRIAVSREGCAQHPMRERLSYYGILFPAYLIGIVADGCVLPKTASKKTFA
jgi:hypothetical protein